jgi:DNA-binding NtrC family response regulator
LASIPLSIPALRDRPEDIEMLAKYFAADFEKHLSERALIRLQSYAWPGNVRELRHAIERAAGSVNISEVVLEEDSFDFLISHDHPDASGQRQNAEVCMPGIYNLKQMERILILRALRLAHGNRAEAAKILGIARSTLFEMLKRYKIIGPKSHIYWEQRIQQTPDP